jgi:hypothetical protein
MHIFLAQSAAYLPSSLKVDQVLHPSPHKMFVIDSGSPFLFASFFDSLSPKSVETLYRPKYKEQANKIEDKILCQKMVLTEAKQAEKESNDAYDAEVGM